jgi:vitamin B12 transporter
MRTLTVLFTLLLPGSALAADLTVKVVDPQSAAVAGAQVSLLCGVDNKTVIATQTTSAEGAATLPIKQNEPCQIRVLAPGFAEDFAAVPTEPQLKIVLRMATASQTVVVTATRTPVPGEDTGADVAVLNGWQLTAMQPTAAADAIRFLPGAIVNNAGQRGGLTSLFVRGGESRYNKVIVDGVTINEPGGTFDFGTLPLDQADRLEFVRGAQSTLYGSDAMTSVVQVWTRTGSTRVPELRFGADGGNFSTAHGFASLSGARGLLDYNLFGSQFNTQGSGINNAYSDGLEGGNVGAALNDHVSLRVRVRHSNSHTGVPGEWSFNGYVPIVSNGGPSYPLPPNPDQASHLNSLLGGLDLAIAAPSGWQHRFSGFDYLYRYDELNPGDPDRVSPVFGPIDFASHEVDRINRVGFEYQSDYSERTWAHTTFVYLQQQLTHGPFVLIAGGRFIHDSAYGNTAVPRVALTWQAWRGNEIFSGTRFRFSYATGFKEPRLEETFNGIPPNLFNLPNTALKPERSRSFEAGVQQELLRGKAVFIATYFNNLFHDQINYVEIDPTRFVGQYVNVNKSLAHGADVALQATLRPRLLLNFAYTYTSTQILDNPAPTDPLFNPGQPLLRRPKHSATETLSYLGSRWGGNLGASFVGPRPDDDFFGFNITHAAGYVRADIGGWYTVNSHVTTYVNVENALDRRYNEVVGYPALPINFRAGVRFRIGGE